MEFNTISKRTLTWSEIDKRIDLALEEDINTGDITTQAIFGDQQQVEGEFIAKEDGVIAGLELGTHIFERLSKQVKFDPSVPDGSKVIKGTIVAAVTGPADVVLTAERTILNFMQRMSGIATQTRRFSDEISHTRARILDTRKTVPGLRELDKWAVRIGGGKNHRTRLDDLFLIKDNHITTAGSITNAIEACVDYRKKRRLRAGIEVEVKNLDELHEALRHSEVDIVLLDNMSPADMKKAVEYNKGRMKLEASGNVSMETVKAIAETGVDYISVGAVTHSVRALDISLLFRLTRN